MDQFSQGRTGGDSADLEIYLSRRDADSHQVILRFSDPDNQAVQPPILGAARLDTGALLSQSWDPTNYGRLLSESLFQDPGVIKLFSEVRAVTEGSGRNLRLRLFIDPNVPDLHSLLWETLADPTDGYPLITNPRIAFSRFLASNSYERLTLRPKNALRALVVIASPSNLGTYTRQNLAPISATEELELATRGLGSLVSATLVSSPTAPGQATMDNLVQNIRQGYDILYLVCHGALSQKNGPTRRDFIPNLLLERADGTAMMVDGQILIEAFRNLPAWKRPQLVILVSCQSASGLSSDKDGALAALGPRLAQVGISVVLAMQGDVSMESIKRFMPIFFEELARDGKVDLAVRAARAAIRPYQDWWMPTLFMRLREGQIWNEPATPAVVVGGSSAVAQPWTLPVSAQLAADVVARPFEQQQVKDRLLQPGAQPGEFQLKPGVVVGLHGMGGIGKTTLAKLVCNDPQVQQACPDGILWVTLGRKPEDLILKINELGFALNQQVHAFTSLPIAREALHKWLQDRRLLLVIDDIWNVADLEPFLSVGPGCAILLTSRLIGVFPRNAALVDIGAMQSSEALDLLGAGLSANGYISDMARLASQLGNWPMLLNLGNGILTFQVRQKKKSLPSALTYIRKLLKSKGLQFMNAGQATSFNEAVKYTLETSLTMLEPEERERYAELSIFPEDQWIPLEVVCQLWGATGQLEDIESEVLVDKLYGFSLLQLDEMHGNAIRLHDLIRDHLYGQLPDPAGTHLCLVSQWGEPPRAADRYAWRGLAYHLSAAALASSGPQRHELTQRLVKLISSDEHQEQYKSIVGDLPALNADLELALRTAIADDHPQSLPLVVRSIFGILSFRQRFLRPDHILLLARSGNVDASVHQAGLFQLDPNWQHFVLLTAAWLAYSANPQGALDLRNRIRAEVTDSPDPVLEDLLAWVDMDLLGRPGPMHLVYTPVSEDLVRALLNRVGGQPYDTSLLAREGIPDNPSNTGTLGLGEMMHGDGSQTTAYFAEQDWPFLLRYAYNNPPIKGMAVLDEYLSVYTNYSYPEYRFATLWIVLKYVVRFPDKNWVKEAVEKILLSALSGSGIEFQEGLGIAVQALRVKAGEPEAADRLNERAIETLNQAFHLDLADLTPAVVRQSVKQAMQQETDARRNGDPWAYLLRRLAALAQAESWLLGQWERGLVLIDSASLLKESGKAGYRTMTNLALAEAIQVFDPSSQSKVDQALAAAQHAAHNVQDTTFCARVTARVNAMRRSWWPAVPPGAATSLVHTPESPEFSTLHIVNWDYPGRRHNALPFKGEHLFANTLGQLAGLYNRAPGDFLRVNRDQPWQIDTPIPDHQPVRVPDPGFIPHLAARFAAAALADHTLSDADRYRTILELVPAALPSLTALDSVLTRLILAWGRACDPLDPTVVAALAELAPLSTQSAPGEPQAYLIS